MMQKIKFKAKCIISNEWVEGDLIHGVGAKSRRVFILPIRTNLAYVKNFDPLDGVEVHPNTVCRNIEGKTDEKGQQLFEGDIYVDKNLTEWEVVYDVYSCRFMQAPRLTPSKITGFRQQLTRTEIKDIIGNIHDN